MKFDFKIPTTLEELANNEAPKTVAELHAYNTPWADLMLWCVKSIILLAKEVAFLKTLVNDIRFK
jgi:hypothetical protein